MEEITRVKDFVDKAVRNYKYTPDAGRRLKKSLDLFNEVLQEDERSSLDVLSKRLNDIVNRVDIKHPNLYTTSSLMVYKSQVVRAISDYQKYGKDATKMASWSPKVIKRAGTDSSKNKPEVNKSVVTQTPETVVKNSDMAVDSTITNAIAAHIIPNSAMAEMKTLDLPLQNDRSVAVYYPVDLTSTEAEKIGVVLKSIALLNE